MILDPIAHRTRSRLSQAVRPQVGQATIGRSKVGQATIGRPQVGQATIGRSKVGQATVEYILILAVIVGLFVAVAPTLRRVLQKNADISKLMMDRMFSSGNLHRYPPGSSSP